MQVISKMRGIYLLIKTFHIFLLTLKLLLLQIIGHIALQIACSGDTMSHQDQFVDFKYGPRNLLQAGLLRLGPTSDFWKAVSL